MTRSISLGLAAAFALVVSLAAQTASSTQYPSTSSDRDGVSVTGCLQKDASGAYTLINGKIEPSKTSSATAGAADTATGTTGMASTAGATWKLEGSAADLDKHVGHKVTVTGKQSSPSASSSSSATTGTTGATGAAAGEEQKSKSGSSTKTLDVKSVTMISSSCS